jgi:hypothetical protein
LAFAFAVLRAAGCGFAPLFVIHGERGRVVGGGLTRVMRCSCLLFGQGLGNGSNVSAAVCHWPALSRFCLYPLP